MDEHYQWWYRFWAYFFITITVAFISMVVAVMRVHADTIPTPVTDTSTSSASEYAGLHVVIPGVVSSNLYTFRMVLSSSAGAATVYPQLCTNSNCTVDSYLPYASAGDCAAFNNYSFSLPAGSSPVTVDVPMKYYRRANPGLGACQDASTTPIVFSGTAELAVTYADNPVRVWGSPTITTSTGVCAGGACSPVGSPAWNINGSSPVVPFYGSTRIISVTPADGESTSTPQLTITYAANPGDSIPVDTVSVDVFRVDNGYTLAFTATTSATLNATTTWLATTAAFPTGEYVAQWVLGNSQDFGNNVSDRVQWSIGTSTWEVLIGATSTSQSSRNALATSTCDYLHLQGCFQNALVWAFIPSNDSMSNLAAAGNAIMLAPPVGYITQYRLAFASTSASGTPAWVVPIGTSTALYTGLISPLRTGIASILVIILCFSLYKQIRTPLDL